MSPVQISEEQKSSNKYKMIISRFIVVVVREIKKRQFIIKHKNDVFFKNIYRYNQDRSKGKGRPVPTHRA